MSERFGESLSGEYLRLQDEAKLARRRFHLYEGRSYGPRATDPVLLSKLERAFRLAEKRLRQANPAAPHMRPRTHGS